MDYSLVFPKIRKLEFAYKIMSIIFTMMVLLIAADSFVQAVTPAVGEIQSGNQYNFKVAQSYKMSNSIYEVSSVASSTISNQESINLNPGDLNILSGVSSQMIVTMSPNTPIFANYNDSIIETVNSTVTSTASLSTNAISGAISLADISINYTGVGSLGIINKYFLYEANSTMEMNFTVKAQSGSIILFISNGYTQVANGFCTLNSVQINGNSINSLPGTSIQGAGGIWSSICPAYLQVNTSGTYGVSATFKSTNGAITGYVLVIGPQQIVNPPASTNTGFTNFPYLLLSAIAIAVVISSVVIVYSFNKRIKAHGIYKIPNGNNAF